MERAAAATRTTNTEAQNLARNGENMQKAGQGFLAVGALAAVGVGLAVSKFMEFDKAMSEVQASTHESASNMDLLRQAAIKAGADSVFSAKEAADAENELAKAGVATADILGGALKGSMDLASAGGLGVADAATYAATAMTQFKLAGSEVPHIADLLAAGAGKAQGSVDDLAQALNQGGLVASQAGQSIEGTTGVLAAFASAGLIGSDAGTSLKTMLLALENPSTKAASVMQEYGINVYDSSGKMLEFSGIAEQLKTKLGGLTDEQRNSALATIFGSDAVRSASVLYAQGADGIQSWNDKVNDAGFAAETARLKLDNLSGDLEYLSGSVDSGLIQTGSSANEVLRFLVQSLTSATDTIGGLPGPILAVGLGLTATTAAVGLFGGGLLTVVPKIAATRLAMQEMNLTGLGLAKSFGKGGLVLAALALAATAMSHAGDVAELTSVDLAKLDNAVKQLGTSSTDLDGLFTGMQGTTNATNGMADAASKLTSSGLDGFIYQINKTAWNGLANTVGLVAPAIKDLANGITKNEAQFKQLGQTLATTAKTDFKGANDQFQQFVSAMGGGEEATKKLLQVMPEYKAALIDILTANGQAASDQNVLNLAMGKGSVAQQAFRDSVAATTVATEEQAKATEAAKQATDDWLKMVSEADSSFVGLQTAYDAVIAKNQEVAQSTADATDSSTDSWKDYYDGISVSVSDYLADLQSQVDAQTNWESNMLKLSGKVSQGTLDELAKMGPGGAPLVAQLVTASGDELAKLDGLLTEKASEATGHFADTLSGSGPIIAAAAAQLGQGVADEIAGKLQAGTATVEQIMTEYKLKVAGYVPTLDVNTATASEKISALQSQIRAATGDYNFRIAQGPGGSGGQTVNENGNLFAAGRAQAFENGGLPTGIYAGRPQAIYKFAEKNVPWEGFISGKPGQETRNRAIALDALNRLGGAREYADTAGRSGSVATSSKHATVNVYPAAGTDERVIGQTAANDLNWRLAMAK
ncbi:phage tail tape measure protein [Subtercola boreus]